MKSSSSCFRISPHLIFALFFILLLLVIEGNRGLWMEAKALEGGGNDKNKFVGKVGSHDSLDGKGLNCKKKGPHRKEENGEREESLLENEDYIYTDSIP